MFNGSPIVESASFNDPLWAPRFLEMANEMVILGAKSKLITRYTGLTQKAVAERYRRLTGEEAPAGRLQQTMGKFYAMQHSRGGWDWVMQSATFARVYLQMEAAFGEPVNRGWLLLTSYQAYIRLTDALLEASPRTTRLTINQGYDLAHKLGSGPSRKTAELRLKECDDCGTHHLIVRDIELDNQKCPMCALNGHYQRLAESAEEIAEKKRTGTNHLQYAIQI